MATNTTKGATPAMPAVGTFATSGIAQYRASTLFMAALGNAKALRVQQWAAPLQLLGHLAYRGAGGAVAWHKGTTPSVLATCKQLHIATGATLPMAMHTVLAHMHSTATTPAQRKAVVAIATACAGK